MALGCGASCAQLLPQVGVKLRCPAAAESSARGTQEAFRLPKPQSELGQLERRPIWIPIRPISRRLIQREACQSLDFVRRAA